MRRHGATLGDSLALIRQSTSATGFAGGTFDVGAYEEEIVGVAEVDGQGLCRSESFPPDRLGDAVVRLYERYAELLPEGPARARAAATAHTVARWLLGPYDIESFAPTLAPDIESVDRRVLATWSARGVEAVVQHLRAWLDLIDDYAARHDDILALEPDAFIVRRITSGTDRAGGGIWERPYLGLLVFGADGRVTRWEQFDVGHEAEALARLDELTAPRSPARAVRRRVRPNAATANSARLDAAVAARDADALAALFADDLKVDDHTTGITFDRQGAASSYRSLMGARDPKQHGEPLATLGDSLALCRASISASGVAGRTFDVGPCEKDEIHLIEVDAQGRRRGGEVFAVDHLGDAFVRLYERYAELLPDGPARSRAAAITHSVALSLRPFDERYAEALSPGLEVVDHRILGTWSGHGPEEFLRNFRFLFDLADLAQRDVGILASEPDAFLTYRIAFGRVRSSGGDYEVHNLGLVTFGADGLMTRIELFDPDRDVEALARLDELTAERAPARPASRRMRPNAATACVARLDAALAARDADALPALAADEVELVDHTTGATFGRQGLLASWRSLLTVEGLAQRFEPLATLGDWLALFRWSMSARGVASMKFDVGPYENEHVSVVEVDAEGRMRRGEAFASARLGDAVVRLYERYAELLPEGPARARAAATARSIAALPGPIDLDRSVAAFSPDVHVIDHRTLGTWSARGAEELLQHWRAWVELADSAVRFDDILGLRPDVLLCRTTFSGSDRAGGGAWEVQNVELLVFGVDGRVTRLEVIDADHDAEALARFDELTAEPAATAPIENAATRCVVLVIAAWEARDWERVAARHAPPFRMMDHRKLMRWELDRSAQLETLRVLFEMPSSRLTSQPLATRGDRLALHRWRVEASGDAFGHDFGPSAFEFLQVIEVDDHGDAVAVVAFDPDDLDAAYAELDARHAAGGAGADARSSDSAQRPPAAKP